MKPSTSNKGFTLIELLVVFAILAILAAILIPRYFSILEHAADATRRANCRTKYFEYALSVYDAKGDIATVPTLEGSTIIATQDGLRILSFSCDYGSGKIYIAPDFS